MTRRECIECGDPATVTREEEITIRVLRYGEHEEDVPVDRHYCAECDPDKEES